MKFLATVALFVLLASGAAIAQTPTPDPSPSPDPKLAAGNKNPNAHDADARECLQLKTNKEIIRCAEKYLPPGSRPKGPVPEKQKP